MKIWLVIAFSLHIAVLVAARHLPYDDDLQADSLVLANKTRRDISVEGSGDDEDDLHEIKPMPHGVIQMERMEAAPVMESRTQQDEGSGFDESPKSEPVIEGVDDMFKEEEGMKDVIDSITSQDATNLQTNDHNRHENTLNVIAGEENSPMTLEEPELIKHEIDVDSDEGSGDVLFHKEDENSEVEQIDSKDLAADISESLEIAATEKPEHLEAEWVDTPESDELSGIEKSAAVHELVITAATETSEIQQPGEESSETVQPPAVDQEEIEVTTTSSEIHQASESTEIPQAAVVNQSEMEPTNESVVDVPSNEPIFEDISTTEQTATHSEPETSTDGANLETTAQPNEQTNDTTEEEKIITTAAVIFMETSSTVPDILTSSQSDITPETTQFTAETSPETIPDQDQTTEVPVTESIVEEINGTVLIPALMEETVQGTAPHLEPKTSSIGWYYVIGLLAVCLVILIAVVALRNRKRGHKLRTDIGPDRDTDKSLLSNGRFKEDSEDNNVKNNEIDPLVIKHNSQINKFEKSPNFSSPKNLNVQAQDKNIEKDNVLKSTQAIIEDEDDAKKEVDDEEEKKTKSVEESSPLIAEKVVVRTHVDLDSIPRKPIVINRNGHSYLAVPGGETKT